jgi:hypothetical protein
MPVPYSRYLDQRELEARISRDIALHIGEAIDAAKIALVESFCGPFDTDVNGEVLVSVNAERIIDKALSGLWDLETELTRKGSRQR